MNITLISHGSSDPKRHWQAKILRHKLDEQANVSSEFCDLLRDAINEMRPVHNVEFRKPNFERETL